MREMGVGVGWRGGVSDAPGGGEGVELVGVKGSRRDTGKGEDGRTRRVSEVRLCRDKWGSRCLSEVVGSCDRENMEPRKVVA